MADGPPKSAVELALEKLAKRDEETGSDPTTLTVTQKEAIAVARQDYTAKVAECRILHDAQMLSTTDPAVRQTLDEQYHRDLARFTRARDKKIAAITAGES